MEKLDALTEKIYREGVDKAQKEASVILDDAKNKADELLKNAQTDAKAIIVSAENRAKEITRNAEAEVKLAGDQALSFIRQKIKDLISVKSLDAGMAPSFSDPVFIKELVIEIIKKWDGFSGTLMLPSSMQGKTDTAFANSIKSAAKDLKIEFERSTGGGFKIIPQDGAYKITFTDADFTEFFKPFLREKTEEILFRR